MKQTPEQRAAAEYPIAEGAPKLSIVVRGALREGFATCIREEVEPLEQWKESAIKVMGEWDKVHEALGKPGKLGESMAAASVAEIERLRVLVQRFVDHNAKWLGKGCLEADIQWDTIVSDCQELGFVPTNTTEG